MFRAAAQRIRIRNRVALTLSKGARGIVNGELSRAEIVIAVAINAELKAARTSRRYGNLHIYPLEEILIYL